jgi:hypothetical protein
MVRYTSHWRSLRREGMPKRREGNTHVNRVDRLLTNGPGDISMTLRLLFAVSAFLIFILVISSVFLVANDEPLEDRSSLRALEGYLVWLFILAVTIVACCVQGLMLINKNGDIVRSWILRLPISGLIVATFVLGFVVIHKLGLGIIGS